MNARDEKRYRLAADNRKARFHYEILDQYEAGIVLTGTEVKSLREGKATIGDSYAEIEADGLYLINAYIPEYLQANRFNHEPKRPRKLLLQHKQMVKLSQSVEREGMTIVPLKVYFNARGRAKVEIALARGKKLHDKREAEKARDWKREQGRILRDRG